MHNLEKLTTRIIELVPGIIPRTITLCDVMIALSHFHISDLSFAVMYDGRFVKIVDMNGAWREIESFLSWDMTPGKNALHLQPQPTLAWLCGVIGKRDEKKV